MNSRNAAALIKTYTVSVSGSPVCLGTDALGNLIANRILLVQAAGGTCTVGDEIVQVAPIPLVASGDYLPLEVSDVGRVWVTGTGTVIVILEMSTQLSY